MMKLLRGLAFASGLTLVLSGTSGAATETVLWNFVGNVGPSNPDGFGPAGGVTLTGSGSLIGTTAYGGAHDDGMAFELNPPAPGKTAWAETILYAFKGGSDGMEPTSALIAVAGEYYGTTVSGGRDVDGGTGTVFKLNPGTGKGGNDTVLYRFQGGADGLGPTGVVPGPGGALFGVAASGGDDNWGTVFRLGPPASDAGGWGETVLYRFQEGSNDQDGGLPVGILVTGNGTIYGATARGGPDDAGTLFRLSPPAAGKTAWTETVLYSFKGGKDGAYPAGGVIGDDTGALYGVTYSGGAHGQGSVYKLTPPASGKKTWTESLLYSFKGGTDGANPQAKLLRSGSELYGTTYYGGGKGNDGTAFELSPGGAGYTETILHRFGATVSDGTGPGPLSFGPGGILYGTTSGGGMYTNGTVYRIVP